MLDTMTMTKVVGAFCGALLVYLLGSWMGEALYATGGHGDHSEQAYVIDTGEDEATDGAAEEEQVPFMTLVAEADPADGQGVWRQCQACHKIDEPTNGVGPHLDGVVGRAIGSISDFNYSGALPDGEWTIDNLNQWLENPSGFAPGTSMSYNGVKDREDRADLVAYLVSKSPDFQMPAAEEAAAAPAETTESTDEAAADQAETDAEAATEAPAEVDTAAAEGKSEGEAAASEEATQEMAAMDNEESGEAPAEEADSGSDASPIMAAYEAADPADGESVFRQCQACHVANQEQNRVGPHLVGILGREIGSIDGFRYSGALPEGEWTLEELNKWLENPREYAQGTTMSYQGLKDIDDRAAVIKYIESLN